MKVIAYKCVHDGQLFEHKEDYQKHLKVLAARRRKEQREQRKKAAAHQLAMKVRSANTVDELRCLIIEHFDALHRYKTGRGSFYKYKKSNVIDIGFSLCFYEICSNTHVCPHNGITNWSKDCTKPTGYKGWRGNISIKVDAMLDIHIGEVLSLMRVFTGTGSGTGRNSYAYSLTLFADDFPNLYDSYLKEQTWKSLTQECAK